MKRRKAREYALQMLFQLDFKIEKLENRDLEAFWSDKKENTEVKKFAEELVRGTVNKLNNIDSVIGKAAENWVVQRMSAVDRNILRFAAYEILYMKDIPYAVTINEAIEIAKKFSSGESAPFINGVLDRIAKEVGKA
ncbi:MAG: transcription antitermination factor NusB [Nitrospirae bacterium]|jgi:N utilization substance protein B|nr:transcription antitermination factor NusB [Nitrospirota bacterium]